MALVRGLPRFDGRAKFTTWLYRVVTNAGLDELRRRNRRPVPSEPDGGDGGWGRPDPGPPVEATVTERMEVDAALATLTPEFRAPVVLRDLLQLDYAEISEVLEIPPGTVRSRIARGRAALAERLGNPVALSERPTEDTP